MTTRFRYFPYLVQQKVMHHMDFIDVFSLYATSKKAGALVRSYFNRMNCEVQFHYLMQSLWIDRNPSSKNYNLRADHVTVEVNEESLGIEPFSDWERLVKLPIRNPLHDPEDELVLLKFAQEMFPKLILSLYFGSDPEVFLTTMRLVRSLNITVKTVEMNEDIDQELMKAVLRECSDVKNLKIDSEMGASFHYDFQSNPPFKFDSIQLRGTEWVTKDHLLNLFFGCKRVTLISSDVSYSGQELLEIVERWLEASETEYLEINETETFPEDIGKLPGAVQVREVTTPDRMERVKQFGPRECYKLKKTNGTPAIIYKKSNCITITTNFENALAF